MKPCRTALVCSFADNASFLISTPSPDTVRRDSICSFCFLSSVIAQRRPITCSTCRNSIQSVDAVRACREAQGKPVRRATLAQGRPSHLCASAPVLRYLTEIISARGLSVFFAPLRLCAGRFCLSLLLCSTETSNPRVARPVPIGHRARDEPRASKMKKEEQAHNCESSEISKIDYLSFLDQLPLIGSRLVSSHIGTFYGCRYRQL